MTVVNPEIVDAAKLVVGTNANSFQTLTPTEIARANALRANDGQSLVRGEVRSLSTYDPTQGCMVMAGELVGANDTGQPDEHLLFLAWERGAPPCGVDILTGKVLIEDDDGEGEANLRAISDVHRRILGALAALADSTLGF